MRDVRTFDSAPPDAAQRPSMDSGRAFQGGQEPKIPQQPWGIGYWALRIVARLQLSSACRGRRLSLKGHNSPTSLGDYRGLPSRAEVLPDASQGTLATGGHLSSFAFVIP